MQQPLRAIYSLLEVCLPPIETDRQVGETDRQAGRRVDRQPLQVRTRSAHTPAALAQAAMVQRFLVEVKLLWFPVELQSLA